MREHVLHKLFEPRSLALVCDSLEPGSSAALALEQIESGGYEGQRLIICPEMEGGPSEGRYSCFSELREMVDLAVMALPTHRVPEQLRKAAEHGCRAAVLLAPDGGEREQRRSGLAAEIRDIVTTYGIALLGPDSLGIIRPSAGLNATISHSQVRPGSVALLAQSVGFSSALLDWAQSNTFGFSLVATPGGAMGINFGELLDFLSVDAETRSVLVYVERISDARTFLSGLRTAARVKPVIVLKSGRAASECHHDIAADRVFDAAIARAGAVRVNTVHQLFTAARALLAGTRVRGPKLGILANASGPALMAADRAVRRGVILSEPSALSMSNITTAVPGARLVGNAVDLLGDASPDAYAAATRTLLADKAYNAVLVLLTPQRNTDALGCARAVVEAAATSQKPILACWMGQNLVADARRLLDEAGVLQFTSPERCLDAFAYLAAYERHQTVLLQAPAPQSVQSPPDVAGARLMIEDAISHRRDRLTISEAKALLSAFHVPVQHSINVTTASDALVAAETLGLPVSLHVNTSDDLPEGQPLPRRAVRDAPAVRSAYRELIDIMADSYPEARVHGIGVQRLAEDYDARDLQVGIEHDVDFGPVITLSPLHGTTVNEIAVSLPPLNSFLCEELVRRALLNSPGLLRDEGEEAALTRLLMRVSEICCALPEVRRLRISPLRIQAGQMLVEDVRLDIAPRQTSTRRYGHMAIHPYPEDLQRRWQLPDGRDVVIRPIRPEDAEMERAFVEGLSPESRYNRFMYRLQKLTPKMLARFTQIDYDREMALAVVLNEHRSEPRILAVARYVTNPDGQSCEFALTVADDVQRQGIGRQIMQSLMNAARDRGLEIMEGDVLSSNRKMLRLCEGLGFRLVRRIEEPDITAVRRHL
ncbi:MAG: GNAT family N-acetyltransferase [Halieaceae bacterium]|jgi:acetyltransferase|nr:GNAT family N-acetyltransferase [Halieaceae bacterium]